LPLLQAIADVSEAVLQRHLTALQSAEFLYETRLFPEHEYTFKHALTHEVAYSSLLLERRRVLHARIVEALEVLGGEGAPLNWRPSADTVAPAGGRAGRASGAPCSAGGGVGQGLAYCRQAGEKAVARSAYRIATSALAHSMPGSANGSRRVRSYALRAISTRPWT
jgi:hypothetical protein